MSYIISVSENRIITASELRNSLSEIISEYVSENKLKNERNIRFAYKLSNKYDIAQLFINQNKIEDIVNLAEYYFTELEIILLALKYDVGIILVGNILSFTTKKL